MGPLPASWRNTGRFVLLQALGPGWFFEACGSGERFDFSCTNHLRALAQGSKRPVSRWRREREKRWKKAWVGKRKLLSRARTYPPPEAATAVGAVTAANQARVAALAAATSTPRAAATTAAKALTKQAAVVTPAAARAAPPLARAAKKAAGAALTAAPSAAASVPTAAPPATETSPATTASASATAGAEAWLGAGKWHAWLNSAEAQSEKISRFFKRLVEEELKRQQQLCQQQQQPN